MPGLITISFGKGTRPFVCDSRCYNATGPDCSCACGGMNHGQGYEKAFENVRFFAANMVADTITREGKEESFIKVKIFDGQRLRRMKI